MPFVRFIGLFAAISVAVTLGACGATLPQTASITTDANAAGAAYPSTAAEKPEGMPSPFADPSRAGTNAAAKSSQTRRSPTSWRRARCRK